MHIFQLLCSMYVCVANEFFPEEVNGPACRSLTRTLVLVFFTIYIYYIYIFLLEKNILCMDVDGTWKKGFFWLAYFFKKIVVFYIYFKPEWMYTRMFPPFRSFLFSFSPEKEILFSLEGLEKKAWHYTGLYNMQIDRSI